MKEWWDNLALREKQILSLGLLAILMLIFYIFIYSPLNDRVTTLREQIIHDQELMFWMQDADKRIQLLEKNAQPPQPTIHETGSLLSIVQKEINHTSLVGALTQIHQVDANSIQLSFQKVDFDKLMAWLIQLTSHHALTISQMGVVPSSSPGVVAADFILKY